MDIDIDDILGGAAAITGIQKLHFHNFLEHQIHSSLFSMEVLVEWVVTWVWGARKTWILILMIFWVDLVVETCGVSSDHLMDLVRSLENRRKSRTQPSKKRFLSASKKLQPDVRRK